MIKKLVVLSVLAALCFHSQLCWAEPYAEIQTYKMESNGRFNHNMLTIIQKNNGRLLGPEGIGIDEAAKIKIIEEYTGQDVIKVYRDKFSVKGESSLVMERDDNIAQICDEALARDSGESGIRQFVLDRGNYYTKQPGNEIRMINKNLYIKNTNKGAVSVGFDYADYNDGMKFSDIPQNGIECIKYLYGDSLAVTQNINPVKKEVVLLGGTKFVRYTFTEKISNDEIRNRMYFFNNSTLKKYGVENIRVLPINTGFYKENKVLTDAVMYNVSKITNHVDDKAVLNISPSDYTVTDGWAYSFYYMI